MSYVFFDNVDLLIIVIVDSLRLREDTLKALLDVVEKLDEYNLQEKLVRCVCNLQNDSEASIRTNSVIFLSRISDKLSGPVRQRVLASSFNKAMKDPFIHCRYSASIYSVFSFSNFLFGSQNCRLKSD